ncbi:MAG: hypothetical protein AVDCRST_MAG93-7433 [uncultured Chloroflexia bacterium]|uniref:Uncharacterized protein n=1 Tax=uncultured Chloroflexia bacterium TaxID=1672391 RepID=A0A6J4MDR6_9CHLR|nr:MAG: hypothetical protein AVDCRST_MAG93-7433 [uncultured Chloroflexia bacterium]
MFGTNLVGAPWQDAGRRFYTASENTRDGAGGRSVIRPRGLSDFLGLFRALTRMIPNGGRGAPPKGLSLMRQASISNWGAAFYTSDHRRFLLLCLKCDACDRCDRYTPYANMTIW